MPAVHTFSRSNNEILHELLNVFNSGNGTVRQQWAAQAEVLMEPMGWDALWKLSKEFCKKFDVRFPCVACVTVTLVDCKTLTATVDVLKVQHKTVSLPEVVKEVPLIELWPTIEQQEENVYAAETAKFIDLMRFFYSNIWMPWDNVLPAETITDRMELWTELHDGSIPNCVARTILLLRNSAINTYEKLKSHTLQDEAEITDDEDFSDDDTRKSPSYLTFCAEMNSRFDCINAEWTLYEKTCIRHNYLAKQKKKWLNNKSRKNVVALWKGGSKLEFEEIAEHFRTRLANEQTFSVTPSAEHALALDPEEVVVCSKQYELPEIPLSQIVVSSLNGALLRSSDMRGCLLMLCEDCELRDLTLHCGLVNTLVVMRSGTLHIRNCALLDDSKSSESDFAQGIVAMGGANIYIENSSFDNFYSGIVVHKGAKVELRNCVMKKCGVGIQMYSGSQVKLSKTTITMCAEQSIRCEIDSSHPIEKLHDLEELGLHIKPNCSIGSGDVTKEVHIVNQNVYMM